MTFSDFEKKAHQQRVKHFVDFINAHDRKPEITDCITIFGFCEADARPIYDDAIAEIMHQTNMANIASGNIPTIFTRQSGI